MSFISAFWLGTAVLGDDRAVERGDDRVPGHVLVGRRAEGLLRVGEQLVDVLGDAEDAEPLGGVDRRRPRRS